MIIWISLLSPYIRHISQWNCRNHDLHTIICVGIIESLLDCIFSCNDHIGSQIEYPTLSSVDNNIFCKKKIDQSRTTWS